MSITYTGKSYDLDNIGSVIGIDPNDYIYSGDGLVLKKLSFNLSTGYTLVNSVTVEHGVSDLQIVQVLYVAENNLIFIVTGDPSALVLGSTISVYDTSLTLVTSDSTLAGLYNMGIDFHNNRLFVASTAELDSFVYNPTAKTLTFQPQTSYTFPGAPYVQHSLHFIKYYNGKIFVLDYEYAYGYLFFTVNVFSFSDTSPGFVYIAQSDETIGEYILCSRSYVFDIYDNRIFFGGRVFLFDGINTLTYKGAIPSISGHVGAMKFLGGSLISVTETNVPYPHGSIYVNSYDFTNDTSVAIDHVDDVGFFNFVFDSNGIFHALDNNNGEGKKIQAFSGIPIVNFVGTPVAGVVPLTTQFTDQSSNITETTWLWDFGDGNTSTEQNPLHVYSDVGTYTVSLTVNGALTEIKTAYITASIIDFIGIPVSGEPPLTVQFTDQSSGITETSWLWDFGDGNTSTQQNPLHVYSDVGTYTVSLTVNGALTVIKTEYITVSIVDFVGTPVSGKLPLAVQFTDQSAGVAETSWLWDFGDGNTSTEQNPLHVYTTFGHFTVTLTVNSLYVKIKIDYITIGAIDFSGEPLVGLYPLTVQFTDQSVGIVETSWLWDFGDGNTSTLQNPAHTYVQRGRYEVSLTIDGITTTKSEYVIVIANTKIIISQKNVRHVVKGLDSIYYSYNLSFGTYGVPEYVIGENRTIGMTYGLAFPNGLATDIFKQAYICDTENKRIVKLDPLFNQMLSIDVSEIGRPYSCCFDFRLDSAYLYVVGSIDRQNLSIMKINLNWTINDFNEFDWDNNDPTIEKFDTSIGKKYVNYLPANISIGFIENELFISNGFDFLCVIENDESFDVREKVTIDGESDLKFLGHIKHSSGDLFLNVKTNRGSKIIRIRRVNGVYKKIADSGIFSELSNCICEDDSANILVNDCAKQRILMFDEFLNFTQVVFQGTDSTIEHDAFDISAIAALGIVIDENPNSDKIIDENLDVTRFFDEN
jgi:PKD repeat protein